MTKEYYTMFVRKPVERFPIKDHRGRTRWVSDGYDGLARIGTFEKEKLDQMFRHLGSRLNYLAKAADVFWESDPNFRFIAALESKYLEHREKIKGKRNG